MNFLIRNTSRFALGLIVLGLLGPRLTCAQVSAPFEVELAKILGDSKVPGASIAVVKNGRIVWAKGFGVLQSGLNSPVTTQTLFQAPKAGRLCSAFALTHVRRNGPSISGIF